MSMENVLDLLRKENDALTEELKVAIADYVEEEAKVKELEELQVIAAFECKKSEAGNRVLRNDTLEEVAVMVEYRQGVYEDGGLVDQGQIGLIIKAIRGMKQALNPKE